MKFFDRTKEIASLRDIREMAKNNAQFTVVTGRRRIGKTFLIWKAYEDEPILYFFVARKAESDLCEDYRLEIENKLGIPTIGRTEHFADIFEFLMKLSIERPITLFIDEFQEFFRVNKSVYSDMQRIWDMYSQKLGYVQPESPYKPNCLRIYLFNDDKNLQRQEGTTI